MEETKLPRSFFYEKSLSDRGDDYREVTPEDYETSWSDYGRALTSGGAGVVSGLAGGAEYLTGGALGGGARRYFQDISQDQIEAMTPVGKRALQAEFLPEAGETSIFDNFTSSLGLKTVAALPSVVSSIIPATAAAKILQGASLAARVGAASAAARGTAGLQAGGDVAGQIYSTIEKLSDEELQAKSTVYAGYRSMMPEAEARQIYNRDVAAAAPAAAFLLTAALGGIEGQVAGRLAGETARGFWRSAGRGAIAEAGQETVESGGGELLAQLALTDQNLAQMNWQKILSKGLEGGLVGGALGGGVGGITGMGAREQATAPDVVQLKGAGTGVASQPATGSEIGDPNARPVGSETQYPKPPSFTLDTLRSRLAGKNIEFPEARLEELQGRIDAANALPNLQRGRAINALLKDLYKLAPAAPPAPGGTQTVAPGVQVGNGPDAAQAAALGVALPVKPIPPQVSAAVQRGPTPAPAPPVAPTRAAPPIPPKVAAAMQGRGAPVDTGTNLQQPNADLLAEQKELIGGQRAVQMFPTNTTPLPLPKGMKKSKTSRGIFHYKPNATLPDGRKVTDGLIQQLSAAGRENELLGLGDRTKQEVDAAAPAEGGVTTVSEVTPEGARVRSVASTAADAERQAQMLQENAAPGNKVVKEPSEEALAPRVLYDITPEGEAAYAAAEEAIFARANADEAARLAKIKKDEKAEAVEGKVGSEGTLRKLSKDALGVMKEVEAIAADAFKTFSPTAKEDMFFVDADESKLSDQDIAAAKAAMVARLKAMVKAYDDGIRRLKETYKGVKAAEEILKAAKRGSKQSDEIVFILRARHFVAGREATKSGGVFKTFADFAAAELASRGGPEAAAEQRALDKEKFARKANIAGLKESVVEEGVTVPQTERLVDTEPSPEARVIATQEEGAPLTEAEEAQALADAYAEAQADAKFRKRIEAKLAGEAQEDVGAAQFTAVTSQKREVKVVKRPVADPATFKLSLKPKAVAPEGRRSTVAGKLSLKPKAAAAVAVAQKAEAKPAETAPAKPAAPAIAMKYIGDGTYLIRFGSVTMRLSTMTLSMPGTYRGLETRYFSYEQAERLPISVYAPSTGTKVEREQTDLARILNNGIYTTELAGSVIPEGLHAPITAYVEDKIDADQFFSQIQDIGRAALAEKAKAKPAERTRAEQFRETYNDPYNSLDAMRSNPDLVDLVAYTDWLGSLTDAQWQKIGPSFGAGDNPFLSPMSMDPVALRAKFEEILGITPQKVEAKLRASISPARVTADDNVVFDTWESRQGRLAPVPNIPPQFAKAFEDIRAITDSLLNEYWADEKVYTIPLQSIENALEGISARRLSVGEFLEVFTRAYNNLPDTLSQQYAALQPEINKALGTSGEQAGKEIVQILRKASEEDLFGGRDASVLATIAEYEEGRITPHQLAEQAFWTVPSNLSERGGKLWLTRFTYIPAALEKVRSAYTQTGSSLPGLEYETGRPTVADAFHGAPLIIEKFSKEFLGRNTRAASAREAFFFARNPDTSNNTNYTGSVGGYRERAYPAWYEDTTARMFLRTYLEQNVRTTPVGKNWDQITAQFTETEQNSFDANVLKYRAAFDKYQELTKSGVPPVAEDNAFEKMMAAFNYRAPEEIKLVDLRILMDDAFDMLEGITDAAAGRQATKPNLVLARIFFKNPYVVDQKGNRYREKSYYEAISDAKRRGHDGVIFLNTFDGGPQDVIYAVFNEDQISDRFLPGRPEGQMFPSMPTGPQPRARVSVKPTGPTVRMAGVDFSPIQSTNVSNSMKMVSDEFYKMFRSGADRLFATFFRDKLTRRVGNVPVHIATPDDMARIYFEATGKVGVPNGIYHNGSIALNVNTVADPIAGLEVAMHEALHAWSENAINSNPGLQRALDVMVARGLDVDRSPYGLTDRYEFVSEAFSSPDFRSFLSSVELSRADRMLIEREIGPVKGPFKTALDAFLQLLRSAMGLPDTLGSYTLLDAVMRAGAKIDAIVEQQGAITGAPSTARASLSAQDIINSSTDRGNAFKAWTKEVWVKIIPTTGIRQQYADTVIGPALKSVVDSILATGPRARQLKAEGDKLATRAADLSNEYKTEFQSLVQVMEEARMLDVKIEGQNFFETNPKTEAIKYWQAKARLPALRGRFSALPPELQQLYRDMAQFYRDSHNYITKASVAGILEGLQLRQIRGKAKGNALTEQQIAELTQRVMDQQMTAADEALLGKTIYTSLENAAAFHRITGDYFPLMRYGDHVVTTTDRIKNTMGGKLEKPDTVLFRNKSNTKARDAAENFVAKSDLRDLSVKKVYFDNVTGKELQNEDEAKSYNDVDIGYRVVMQTKGVYFFETGTAAEAFSRTNPEGHDQISKPEKRIGSGYQAETMSGTQVSALNEAINSRVKSKDITEGQGELIKSIVNQAAIRMLGGNRIASRRLKSQKVTGASGDIARNMLQYNAAAASHIAIAENAPTIRDGLAEMSDVLREYSGDDRAQLLKVVDEMKARVGQGILDPNAPGRLMKDIMTYAFLARLFSPAYTILQGMQPFMVTIPTLGSRYGNMAASAEVGRAFNDIGFGDVALQGALNTARAAKQTFKAALLNTDDIVGSIRKKVSASPDGADILRMMDEAIRVGAIDGNAGLEITSAAAEGRGKYGQTLAGVDRIARQLPQMMEAVNRSVSGIAAYRLARKNGKTHEQATQYAVDVIQNTQGDYSAANSPRFFNNPVLRPALMFKKYALMMTYLLGDMVYRSFNGATPEEKRIARKQVMNIVAVQILIAGAFSLPGLEIFKVAFLVASAFGLGGGWDEFENDLREILDASVGKTLGEMISSGLLSRAFGNGVDLSQRMSLADMWLFGEPKGDSSESMQAYMFRQAVGAPGGYLLDVRDAAVLLSEGEFAKAFGKFIPVKFIADFTKAAYGYGEAKYEVPEKRAVSGVGELAFNTLGFRTGRQAELGRERGIAMRERQDKQKEFQKLMKQYRTARTKGDMAKAIAKNREWNASLSKGEFRMKLPVKPRELRVPQ